MSGLSKYPNVRPAHLCQTRRAVTWKSESRARAVDRCLRLSSATRNANSSRGAVGLLQRRWKQARPSLFPGHLKLGDLRLKIPPV